MLKISLLFERSTNYTDKSLENSYDYECQISIVLLLHDLEYIGRF